ncbi:MAG: universal stress protein [Rhodopseudomonas palustris]|nr:universal stress protein [Rhodopseudomonas palustris]
MVGIVEDDISRAQAQAGVADVVAWLGRHEVAATGLVPDEAGNVALQLDRLATASEAGVIVAGAYGHSRFREWILGGVTQYLVTQTRPLRLAVALSRPWTGPLPQGCRASCKTSSRPTR